MQQPATETRSLPSAPKPAVEGPCPICGYMLCERERLSRETSASYSYHPAAAQLATRVCRSIRALQDANQRAVRLEFLCAGLFGWGTVVTLLLWKVW